MIKQKSVFQNFEKSLSYSQKPSKNSLFNFRTAEIGQTLILVKKAILEQTLNFTIQFVGGGRIGGWAYRGVLAGEDIRQEGGRREEMIRDFGGSRKKCD